MHLSCIQGHTPPFFKFQSPFLLLVKANQDRSGARGTKQAHAPDVHITYIISLCARARTHNQPSAKGRSLHWASDHWISCKQASQHMHMLGRIQSKQTNRASGRAPPLHMTANASSLTSTQKPCLHHINPGDIHMRNCTYIYTQYVCMNPQFNQAPRQNCVAFSINKLDMDTESIMWMLHSLHFYRLMLKLGSDQTIMCFISLWLDHTQQTATYYLCKRL